MLAVGVNASKNNPMNCSYPKADAAIHAEEAAIRALPEGTDTSRLTLYVARLMRKDDSAGLSKPCPRCAALIEKLGFKDVYWT